MSDGNRQNDANDGNGRNGYVNSALDVSTENVSEDEIRGSEAFMVVTQDNLKSGKTSIKKIGSFIKERASKIFKKKTILKRIPITNWLPKYNLTWAVGDLVAGITVGLTVIPQALAFASIVGLPPQYGLYGSFLGSFIYVIFGSSKDVPMGPTALICLLTYQATGDYGVEHAILLAFLAGAIELAMGLLGIGFIIDFISGPVASGFTSAVALIIFSSQIKDILGIAVRGNTFLQIWISIFENIGETTMWDPIMGCSCIIILLLMRKLAQVKIGPKASTSSMVGRESPSETVKVPKTWHNIVNKSLWLLSTARNALLVIVGGFIANALYEEGTPPPFKLIGHVPEGLPGVKLPPFGFENENVTYTFGEMVSNLGTSIAVVPLISMLENIALCKAFADGKPVDATQELIAIGLCNIGNSFLQAYPGTGALARGAVNNNSGVKTPFGGVYTGILVILSLLFFTPYFFYIPKATLAAVIIAAAVFTVEIKVIRPMWRSKKSDLIPGFVTFIACLLLPLEYGIIIGIALDILFILYHAARPKILIEKLVTRSGIEYLMLAPDRCLIFPSAEYVRKLVTKHSIKEGIPVTIDCSHIYGADFSTALVIESLSGDFAARYQPLVFYNLKPSVSAVFEGLSPKEFVVVYTQEQLDDFLDERCSSKSKGTYAA